MAPKKGRGANKAPAAVGKSAEKEQGKASGKSTTKDEQALREEEEIHLAKPADENDDDEEMEDVSPEESTPPAAPATKAQKRKVSATAPASKEEPSSKAPRRSARQAGKSASPPAPAETNGSKKSTDKTSPKQHQKKTKPESNGAKATSKPASKSSSDAKAPPKKSSGPSSEANPTTAQLLSYLLSPSALDTLRPADEAKALSSSKDDLKTYTASALTPFTELLAAIILSRPISHVLGHRSIRTVLNEPYDLTSAKKVTKLGREKVTESMYDAHTQHKDKTAAEMYEAAERVLEVFESGEDAEGESLAGLREKAGRDYAKERDLLQKEIKGIGPTGLDIFFRRVQWLWPEVYPFVDGRTAEAVGNLGLPSEPQELAQVLEENWAELKKGDMVEIDGEDDEQKKRRAFVIILERAVLAGLEKKADAVKEAAVEI